ncbi:ATPase AAA [Caldimicrobium thiodismutans]|uniref:ATPase AAA n=1 Tax=Caldimicrobium thiodismutans TaxID=1653476 RepID=A0A0U4N3E8_9BACT|nr:MoxR family ATPase [Caldimicrobium thiodismutans]BAU23814.1 ATPase AAA [Caldimicrobium thiodismutans]
MRLFQIFETLRKYLSGKESALELTLITLLARGHLLIEDLPGVGKTTLALSLAKILGLSFSRIQGTSDLLPSDITGASIYNKKLESFEFHPGPIFAHIVLVDEINRMSPKTQSALLEPMEEGQVTVDGVSYPLPRPFFLIATQNPIEYYGTFPLPEAQLDRFLMKISIGYPPRDLEREILKRGSLKEELSEIPSLFSPEEILRLQEEVKEVYVSEKVLDYVLDIVSETRKSPFLRYGLSTRGALLLLEASKARAYLYERDYVLPEDIKALSSFVLPHRLGFKEEYEGEKDLLIIKILEEIKIPL